MEKFHLPGKKKEKELLPSPQKKKKLFIWQCLIFILPIFFALYWVLNQKEAVVVDPISLAQQATENTLQAETLHFTTTAQLNLDGELRHFNNVQGDKGGENLYHIYGEVLGTQLNVYQIENTTYRQDPLDNKWHIIEQNTVAEQSLLMAELNPLNDFCFLSIPQAEQITKDPQKEEDKKAHAIIRCQPELANQWIAENFQNITYTLWISKGDTPYIIKAIIDADSKDKADAHLQIQLTFSEFNKQKEIKAPTYEENENISLPG